MWSWPIERALMAAGILSFAAVLVYTDALHDWDALFYDLHQRHWASSTPNDVVIVAIDERSLEELGRWPWGRAVHADLIDRLGDYGVAAIGFDVIFAEPDARDPDADARLAQALANSGRVVLPVVPEMDAVTGQITETFPIDAFVQASAALGHVDLGLDKDGVVRSAYLAAGHSSPRWAQFGLATLRVANPDAVPDLPGVRNTQTFPERSNAWVRDYEMLVPFLGPPGAIRRISYVDVLQGNVAPEILHGSVVLVGATAAGLGDSFGTPVSNSGKPMTGVEIHANIISSLSQGIGIRPLSPPWRLLATLVLVLLAVLINDLVSPRKALIGTLGALLFTGAFSVLLVRGYHLWFAPAPALLGQFLCYPLWNWRRLEHTKQLLAEQRNRLQVTLNSIGDGVIKTDRNGSIEYMNLVAETLTGTTFSEVRGQPVETLLQLKDEETGNSVYQPVSSCVTEDRVITYPRHSVLMGLDGSTHSVHALAAPIRDAKKQNQGVVVTITDVSESRDLAQRIAYSTTHDALTHLPNRNLLQDRLESAIARAQRSEELVVLMLLDLDHFKTVNDALGHPAGDVLLCRMADRLKACCRQEDTVARVGGDEFVFVVEKLTHEEQITAIAHKVHDALQIPFRVENHEFTVTGSIGISVFPKDGQDAASLLKNADDAMYQAKGQGRNKIRFCTRDLNKRALDRLVKEQKLRRAINKEQLCIHYQPVVALESRQILALEALVRWPHADLGLLSPSEFIPLAEETGMIASLGQWVLRCACRQLQSWHRQGAPGMRVAINLSARQFTETDLTELVTQALEEAGLDGQSLDLEITESMVMRDADSTIATLRGLKDLGVHLSIDDFGTGYSSLNYLKRFPIDRLKIDKSFVSDIHTDSDSEAIVMAIIAMARTMNLKVIAEGVETREQLEFLKRLGCDEIQGFLVSQPLPVEELTPFLVENEAWTNKLQRSALLT